MAPRPTHTFLDSGVLIAAYKGSPSNEEPASLILDDPDRVFLSSPFVRHEVSPKALFNKQALEYRFYQGYFRRALFCDDLKAILSHAGKESANRRPAGDELAPLRHTESWV